MPIQDFNIYTANGYAGDLVDSGPRVVQTGVLTTAAIGYGIGMQRDAAVERGAKPGAAANVYAISQRELNHEATNKPSDGATQYNVTESVSMIREGYLYIELGAGAAGITAGEALHVVEATGVFNKDTIAAGTVACTNVFAEETGVVGDIIKVRIDIV